MKRFFIFALIASVFASCSTDATQDLAPAIPTSPDELYVSFDEEDTRIQLGEDYRPVWTKGDLVSVFYKSDGNDCYKFTGATGDRSGTLMRTSVGEWSRRGDNVVVVYPYNKEYIISLASNTVEASLPAEQTYLKDSYGVGSSLMVASGDYKQFALKNVCGWLKLQFTGSGYVSKIVLHGNNGEQVAGDLLICADDASCILAEASADINDDEVGGALLTESSILTEVTLNCGDIALNPETPTAFYIALPPQTFEKGATIDVLWTDGSKMTKSVTNSLTIERNHIVPMASIPVQPTTPPANEIWYTSSDGNIVEPYYDNKFGAATLLSNTYENGKGIIKFNGNVTEIGYDAFYSCNALKSINIPNSVTKIGNYAFMGCSALTSVTIPNSVTKIGYGAFDGCKALESIIIPDSVTSIGDYTFYGCSALESVTIGNSVTAIGIGAFRECYALKSFYGKFVSEDNRCLIIDGVLHSFAPADLTTYTIPNGVTSIGEGAFYYCRALTSVNIPNSVTEIGEKAFYECTSLTSVAIGNGVTEIGEWAFYECTSLTSVAIGNGVTEIGNYAFYDCTSLTSVTIPNSVTSIGEGAFRSCYALKSVTIGNGVTEIGNYAFYFCYALKEVYCKPTTPPTGGSQMFDYNGYEPIGCTIYVPTASVDAYKAAGGWNNYADAIEGYDFQSTNEIWYTSTDGEIINPYATDVFGANILSNTYENGQGVIIFDGDVTSIGNSAFQYCSTLTSVNIPNSVTEIGEKAFYKCSVLTNVTIPNSVTEIGYMAFSSCYALTSVTIPNSVTSIGGYAFFYCSALTNVTIPNSVIEIGNSAFYNCDALTSVTIGHSVTKIGNMAFSSCYELTSFYGKFASEDNHCLIIDGVLNSFAPARLTTYSIPNSVTSIGERAFYNCDALTSVIIPSSVTEIGNSAFAYCKALTSVTIPNSATEIGNSAFYYCGALKEVYCKPTTPPTGGDDMFCSNASGRRIYVPTASVSAYKAKKYWSDYADYIEPYNFTE